MMKLIDTRKGQLPQNHYINDKDVIQLLSFRQELRAHFTRRPDAMMNLIDAIANNTHAKSIAELSLNATFDHQYSSVYDAIDQFFTATEEEKAIEERRYRESQLMNLCLRYLRPPTCRSFWLFALDTTPNPRPYAQTLADRSFVSHPNPIGKNRPITVGHQYGALVHLPERSSFSPPWVVPLSIRRVKSEEKVTLAQAQQLSDLLTFSNLGESDQFCVCVGDSTFNAVDFLGSVHSHKDLVTITRTRANRVLYQKPEATPKKRGHPKWYGDRFDLKDCSTWGTPSEVDSIQWLTRSGRELIVHLQSWHHLLIRGTHQFRMHNHPLTLVRVWVTDGNGKPIFKRPLWLSVVGKNRAQLSLCQVYTAYQQRYDIEHFFRFGKQRLLTTRYQTPDIEHEQNWWQITSLAYVQLFLARQLAEQLPNPWERYLPQYRAQIASPSMVQRDFGRIIRTIEPNRGWPKPRGKSPGRLKGANQTPRERQKVIYKGKKRDKSAA